MPDVPSVVVVGSCNLDIVIAGGPIPTPGQTVAARTVSHGAGGKGLNQAIAAARMGGAVTMVGAVGDDSGADIVLAALREACVDCSHIRRLPGPTGTAIVTVGTDGDNAISVVPGANSGIQLSEADLALIGSADVLLLQLEIPIDVVVRAATTAHEAGAAVFLTPAPVHDLPDELMSSVSVLLVNQHEALDLTGLGNVDSATTSLASAVPTVVVTRGSDGSQWAGATTGSRPAIAVEVVDTTAAGDTFAGSLAVVIAEGLDMDEAIDHATVAAAITVTRRGASQTIPTRTEVEKLLAVHNT